MTSTNAQERPKSFYSPGWHETAETPVVDGKYYDPSTGEVRSASDHAEYSGPPAVDMIIKSIHAETTQCVLRAARPFKVEDLTWQVVKVIHKRQLTIDSIMVTKYAIRVVLAHELTVEEFQEVSDDMVNGIWGEE